MEVEDRHRGALRGAGAAIRQSLWISIGVALAEPPRCRQAALSPRNAPLADHFVHSREAYSTACEKRVQAA
jgi:hypothetical protein